MTHPLFEKHHETLTHALEAIHERDYYSAYPEVPSGKIYGETAKKDGWEAFQGRLNGAFEMDQPGKMGMVGAEKSPYGIELNIKYPQCDYHALIEAGADAMHEWRDAGVEARVGVCLEILDRLNKRSFELANAVMHTTGQGFMMAFQAGGPHAQDRGLEAIAYAYDEMTRHPDYVQWRKQVGKDEFVTLDKIFHLIPRGVAVLVGCSTFPTWNGYPGLFASLVTGNAVVIKPHPLAILPLAITAEIARDVLKENDFDPNLVTLAVDTPDAPVTKDLVTHPEVKIVDYTGSSEFGEWIEINARQAVVFTEKAGVNSMILDSADDLKQVARNLAFSLCLYSGQMCTTPRNIFIPKDGMTIGGEKVSFDDVVKGVVSAVNGLLGDPARAAEVLGCIQNERTLQNIEDAKSEGGTIVRESEALSHEMFPQARIRSPLMLVVDAEQEKVYCREVFGPVVYFVKTESTDQSIDEAEEIARRLGAITCGLYSTDDEVLENAQMAMLDAGVPVSCNLTGQIYVNQSAAFSDFHVSGANPSGNATLCDAAYVANRFRVVQTRIPAEE